MNAPAPKIEAIALDKPMFDPKAYRLNDEQAALITKARELAQTNFAPRASKWDREAIFPMENYRDMHKAGLLGISIPKANGGSGA
ncbi:MAG: acyl-CoA dehydrogenase family protein, partial [Tardiphaga sp.]